MRIWTTLALVCGFLSFAHAQVTYEDFDATKLFWEPLGGNTTVHGMFSVIPNPDASGINTSANVGSHTKGSSNFSTLSATLGAPLDLSQSTQIDIQVWPPVGATDLTMQLNSATQGNKEVTVAFSGSGAWETVSFDFANFNSITDFIGINLLFDPGSAGAGTYYIDNLVLTGSTVDPCAGIDPIPNFLDDFECQRNVSYSAGGDVLESINNPDVSPANATSKVGEYTDPVDELSALVIDFGAPIDLAIYNQLQVKIWSSGAVPLKFTLEGGTSAPVEVEVTVSATGEWVDYMIDFSGEAGKNHQKIGIFFNAGVLPTGSDIYYVDEINMARAPYTGCIATFENIDFTIESFQYFANAELDTVQFEVIENPDKSGINDSDSVGIFYESPNGETFAGMFTTLDAPVSLPNGDKTVRMKMWADHTATMVFKLEAGRDGAPNSGDITADYTTPNAWQELTFDFSSVAPDDALYDRLTLIPDIVNIPAATSIYYFDDIVISNADCSATTSLFQQLELVDMTIYPNPTSGKIRIECAEGFTGIRITNLMGQTVSSQEFARQAAMELDLGTVAPGLYFVTGYQGDRLISRTKLIKE